VEARGSSIGIQADGDYVRVYSSRTKLLGPDTRLGGGWRKRAWIRRFFRRISFTRVGDIVIRRFASDEIKAAKAIDA
jgi:hypothetical protein